MPRSNPSHPRHGQSGGLAAATPARCAALGILALVVVAVLAALPRQRPAAAAEQGRAPSPVAAQHFSGFAGGLLGGAGSPGVAQSSQPPAPGVLTTTIGRPSPGLAASALASDGIPETALVAYENAAQRESLLDPACHLTWPLLAAIGRVESDHGRFAGAVLYTDGRSYPRIIGIPLNGDGTALIRDTDGGRLDGDPVYDHAVGPMQFIPSTWARWGVDVDSDGVADPFDIFDAAASTADYLCASGADLATLSGQYRAVFTYNHSDEYVRTVIALAATYAAGVPDRDILVVPSGAAPTGAPGSGSSGASHPGAPSGVIPLPTPGTSPGSSSTGDASGTPGDTSGDSPASTPGSSSSTAPSSGCPDPTDTSTDTATPTTSDSPSAPASSDAGCPAPSPSSTPADSTGASGSPSDSSSGSDTPTPTDSITPAVPSPGSAS